MRSLRNFLSLGAALIVLAAAASGLGAQAEVQFWIDYAAAVKDPAGFGKKKRLVEKNKALIQRAVSYQVLSLANAVVAKNQEDRDARLHLLEDLARMYDLVYRSKVLDRRVAFAGKLDVESATILADTHQQWVTFLQRHQAGEYKKSPQALEQLLLAGQNIIDALEGIDEDFILGDVCNIVASYHELKEDWTSVVETLAKAKRCFARHKRKELENNTALRLLKIERERGIKVGGSGEAKAKVEEKKERREPKKFPAAKTRYRKDKGPDRFPSANLHNYHDHMLWKMIQVPKDEPKTWPIGDGSVVKWEGGSKLFLDVHNTGKKMTRLKAAGGSQKAADLKVRYNEGAGRYRLLVRGLGQQEKFMDGEFNYAPTKDLLTFNYARACHLEGTFQGVKFALIDDNVNGKYDDYGVDVVQIGKQPIQPLSKVMDIGGTLYSIERVKPDGSEIHFLEYVGDTGKLQVKWTGARTQPTILVFQCTRGEFENTWVNLAGGQPVTVPNGWYQFKYGILTSGKGKKVAFAQLGTGESKVFEVKENETVVQNMGAPFDVFCAVKGGGKGLILPGGEIRIRGAFGEVYYNFYPEPIKPTVAIRVAGGATVVRNRKLGRPSQDEYAKVGRWAMFHPAAFEFHGTVEKKYEARFTLKTRLLGVIKGNWNEVGLAANP